MRKVIPKYGILIALVVLINLWIGFLLAYEQIYQSVNWKILYWWWAVHIAINVLIILRIWSLRWGHDPGEVHKERNP